MGSLLRLLLRAGGIALLLVGLAVVAARLDPLPAPLEGMAHASDGDSLRLGGERLRLLGLDAPELDQVCWDAEGAEWPCGRAARTRLAELLAGAPVSCQPEGRDRFGRVLARCAVDGRDLGAAIVEAGLAVATDAYDREQGMARRDGRGIWQGRFTTPREWRDNQGADAPEPGLLESIWNGFRQLTGARLLP